MHGLILKNPWHGRARVPKIKHQNTFLFCQLRVGEGPPASQKRASSLGFARPNHWPSVKSPRSQCGTAAHEVRCAVLHPAPNPRGQRGVGIKKDGNSKLSTCFSQHVDGCRRSVVVHKQRSPPCSIAQYCLHRVQPQASQTVNGTNQKQLIIEKICGVAEHMCEGTFAQKSGLLRCHSLPLALAPGFYLFSPTLLPQMQ